MGKVVNGYFDDSQGLNRRISPKFGESDAKLFATAREPRRNAAVKSCEVFPLEDINVPFELRYVLAFRGQGFSYNIGRTSSDNWDIGASPPAFEQGKEHGLVVLGIGSDSWVPIRVPHISDLAVPAHLPGFKFSYARAGSVIDNIVTVSSGKVIKGFFPCQLSMPHVFCAGQGAAIFGSVYMEKPQQLPENSEFIQLPSFLPYDIIRPSRSRCDPACLRGVSCYSRSTCSCLGCFSSYEWLGVVLMAPGPLDHPVGAAARLRC